MVNNAVITEGTDYKMCLIKWTSRENHSQKEYAFVLVPLERLDDLETAIKSLQDYNLQEYGVVVESGIGEPTEATLARIKAEFHCDF